MILKDYISIILAIIYIISYLISLLSVYFTLKYRISLLEHRLDLLEHKDLPDFKSLIHSDLVETKNILKCLTANINDIVRNFEKLELEFKIRVKEN